MKNRSVLLMIAWAVLALTTVNGVLLVERHLETFGGATLAVGSSAQESEFQTRELGQLNLDWLKPTGPSQFSLAKSGAVTGVSPARVFPKTVILTRRGQIGTRLGSPIASVVLRL